MAATSRSTRPYYKLNTWKGSMALVKHIYAFTGNFPVSEAFGLTSQMRRAAVSIPSNIAEGAARTGAREFAQFLNVAKGSLSELDTQILIARDLGFGGDVDELLESMEKVSSLLAGLHKKVVSG